jgi:hypothetical protein
MNLLNRIKPFFFCIFACTLQTGCENPYGPPDQAVNFIDTEVIQIESVETESIAPLEGPYLFIQINSLSEIVLANTHAKTGLYQLIGLKTQEYEKPGPVDDSEGHGEPERNLTDEELQAIADRAEALDKLRIDAMLENLDEGEFWIMRMANTTPAPIYLFRLHPDVVMDESVPVSGQASLVNAELVRKGQALMEVMGKRHPYYQRMLDCQVRSMLDHRHKRKAGSASPSIWQSFDLNFPEEQHEKRFRYVEELLYQ